MIRLLYHNFLSILDDLPQKVLEDIKDYFKDKAFASLQLRMPLYPAYLIDKNRSSEIQSINRW